jgi:hypothetical protein
MWKQTSFWNLCGFLSLFLKNLQNFCFSFAQREPVDVCVCVCVEKPWKNLRIRQNGKLLHSIHNRTWDLIEWTRNKPAQPVNLCRRAETFTFCFLSCFVLGFRGNKSLAEVLTSIVFCLQFVPQHVYRQTNKKVFFSFCLRNLCCFQKSLSLSFFFLIIVF